MVIPDRYTDIISNTILDKCLEQDANSRVAVEVLAKDDNVIIGGEVTTEASLDIPGIVKEVTKEVGYDWEPKVTNLLSKQSPDIAMGTNDEANAAGDQGIMFGYATSEGPNYMPLAWSIAKDIIKTFEELRVSNNEDYNWIKPDMKSQVTIDYSSAIPVVKDVVISIQTREGTNLEEVRPLVRKNVFQVLKVQYKDYIDVDEDVNIYFNETGKFEIGGPFGDCGVTGRKIVVDQYGGYAPVGGGNLNGKDPTKVDRSAAYMMRYIAKNIVASGIMSECTIQCSYCIGVSQPVSLNISTPDSLSDEFIDNLERKIMKIYDLSPRGIINFLELRKPLYVNNSKYGAFGNPEAKWEQIDDAFSYKLDSIL